MTIWFCGIILFLFKVSDWQRWQHMWTWFAWKKNPMLFCSGLSTSEHTEMILNWPISDWFSNAFFLLCDVFSGVLQVPIPEASREDKKLCQRFGQLIFKVCYSLVFCASTRFQNSLISAKQLWFLSTQRDPQSKHTGPIQESNLLHLGCVTRTVLQERVKATREKIFRRK